MRKVIVTGASGLIGRHVLPFLVEAGFQVHALTRGERISFEYPNTVQWHKIDLMRPSHVDELLADIQATHLLHFAWYTEHGKFWNAPENLQWVACSLNVLKRFVECGGERVVIAGSCAEYDWSVGRCVEQETACNPSTLYGASKHALYQIANTYCAENNVSLAWGRIFFLYGPGENQERFVPVVINGLLQNQVIPCSHGSQIRDFMYVEDMASAFATLLKSNLEGVVNIASGEASSLKEIGERLMCLIGGAGYLDFGSLANRPNEPAELIADVFRLRTKLNWNNAFSLEEGLAKSVEWARSKGDE